MGIMSNSTHALDALSKKGFKIPNQPAYEIPSLPIDITELHDEDLMELFVTLTSWTDYVAPQVAVAAIDERECDRYVSVLEATAMVNNWKGGSGDRVTIAKANILLDPKVIEAKQELDEKHAYRKLVEVLLQNLERDAALVSRELTRRTSDSGVKARSRRYTV
jgi:hypothetical protein